VDIYAPSTPHPCLHPEAGLTNNWTLMEFGVYKILFHFEASVHESIFLVYPPPTCIAGTIPILLHVHCAIYDAPSTALGYAIHHTILAIAISCKGHNGIHTLRIRPFVRL